VVRLVLTSAGGTQRLSRTIGIAKAKELIFTGRILNAKGALEDGTVIILLHSKKVNVFFMFDYYLVLNNFFLVLFI